MNLIETIKSHPVPVIGGGLVLALLVASRGTASASPNASSVALSSQQLADNTNVSLAGINAQVEQANITGQTQLGLASISSNAQQAMARTSVMGGLFNEMIGTQAALSANDTSNATQQTLAAYANSANLAQISAQHDLGSQAIQASVTQNARQMDTAIKLQQMAGDQQVAALNSPNYASALQTYEHINSNNNQTAIQLAGINSTTQQAVARTQMGPAQTQADTNQMAGMFNMGASVLSMFGF